MPFDRSFQSRTRLKFKSKTPSQVMFLVRVVGVKRHNLLKPRMLIYIFCTSSHILVQTTEFNVLFLSEENC